ncbi:MAG TPA: DUF5615 family PIN-like protein, partial [Chloroflexia bacterium]
RNLLDENVDPVLRRELLKRVPEMDIWRIGEPGAVPLSTPDPEILRWCEEHDVMLITNNRKSMPEHLRDHIAEGRHIPGIVVLDDHMSMGHVLDELLLIWGASLPDEYKDTFVYLRRKPKSR